ncbi:MAG TPA: right-handed parallel beta-helix repeat-containing protein [Pyrinomonadaceae bacterium]|nr:right-handed parallel beta-helix repeat-containing protein [Pyrinomonadaceae bacterium]
MNKIRFTLKAVAFLAFTLVCASAAQAQATRTWVSGVGDDVNPCSRTAPCKTFAGAISKTADKGEIDCLDPGGFGTVTITKNITIDGTNGAGFGSILAAGTNGVNVNDVATASPNSIIVNLRNLSIQGAGSGFSGIRFVSGKVVHVEHCTISGFKGNGASGHGIDVSLTASNGQKIYIKDTIIEDCTGDGISVKNTAIGGSVNALIEDSQISQCNNGITVGQAAKAVIKNSSFLHNTTTGVGVAGSGIGAELEGVLTTGQVNGIALVAGTSRISNCRVTNNTNGINFAGGTVVTYGDNKFDGNTNESVGGALPAPINKK